MVPLHLVLLVRGGGVLREGRPPGIAVLG